MTPAPFSQRYVILGHPVAHSRSPAMHQAAFEALGIDARYVAWDVPPERWGDLRARLHAECVAGGNVTVPHKSAFLALADASTETARVVGAANTFRIREGKIECTNTDVGGFREAAVSFLRRSPAGMAVAVLGAGGSARAVVRALSEEHVREIRVIHHRDAGKAESLRPVAGATTFRAFGPLARADGLADADLVVNTTPAGLHLEDGPALEPEEAPNAALYDLVYPRTTGARETPTVSVFRAAGLRAESGGSMLLAQGARSFRYWTGRDAPREAMRAALHPSGGGGR